MGLSAAQIGILRPVANDQYEPARPSLGSASRDFKSALVDATSSRRSERARAEKSIQNRNDQADDAGAAADQSARSGHADENAPHTQPDSSQAEADAGALAAAGAVQTQTNTQAQASQSPERTIDATSASRAAAERIPATEGQDIASTTRPIETPAAPASTRATPDATAEAETETDHPSTSGRVDAQAKPVDAAGRDAVNTTQLAADGNLTTSATAEERVADAEEAPRPGPKPVTKATAGDPASARDGGATETDSSKPGEPGRAVDARPTEENRQVARRELREAAQETRSDTQSVGESVFEEKVRRWIDGRREGDEAKPAKTGSGVARVGRSGELATQLQVKAVRDARGAGRSDDAKAPGAPVRVVGGKGDGAAAAVGRLLVEGGGEHRSEVKADAASTPAATATTVHGRGPVSAASSVPHSGPSTNSPAGVVAELLAARHDGGDAIEGAARALNASGGSGRYLATMKLDPPEMGQLSVQVRMNQQAMTLHVKTDSDGVSRLIESRMSDLRDALATHGIRIDKAEVVTKSPGGGESQPGRDQSQGGDSRHTPHQSSRDGSQGGWADGRGWNGSNNGRAYDGGGGEWGGDASSWVGEAEPAGNRERLSLIGDRSVDVTA